MKPSTALSRPGAEKRSFCILRGAPPEEVIVELKSLISSLLAAGADERVASWHLANDVSELVVRLAIESYFSD